jgi:hypothetical protein
MANIKDGHELEIKILRDSYEQQINSLRKQLESEESRVRLRQDNELRSRENNAASRAPAAKSEG